MLKNIDKDLLNEEMGDKMKNQEEALDNPIRLGLVFVCLGLGISLPLLSLLHKKETPKAEVIKEHVDFKLPDFRVNDCFLVSKAGESLHPHFIKILDKDLIQKRFEVLEIIGNGKDKEVNVRLNYYNEMKSFANYRENCPKFLLK